MSAATSAEILARYREGDPQAAEELFARYVSRLTLLARSRLSPRLAARTDPADIVLSAYRSFFVGAREGRFLLKRSGDLWGLLVEITMRKLYRAVRKHTAEKRSVSAETPLSAIPEDEIPCNRDPSPAEALAMTDQLESLMTTLDEFTRRVLELRLQDEKLSVIANDTGRSERTVRRALHVIQSRLRRQLETEDKG